MNNDLIVQKVLRTISVIKKQIENSKREIRSLLNSMQSEEAAAEYRTLKAFEFTLRCLEEDFEETEETEDE